MLRGWVIGGMGGRWGVVEVMGSLEWSCGVCQERWWAFGCDNVMTLSLYLVLILLCIVS